MHWVAVAAACFEEFSRRLIIFLLMVVPTASLVVTLRWSAARFSRSWLDSLPWLEAHCLAASTMSAVASARAFAADNSRFWERDGVRFKYRAAQSLSMDETVGQVRGDCFH